MIDGALMAALPLIREVVARGSFTAAASRFGVSASAVSQAVRQFEARAGRPILVRNSRGVRLTPDGERLMATIGDDLLKVEAALGTFLSGAEGPVRGTLRISSSRLAADLCLVPRLPEFVARHPEVCLDIRVDDRVADLVNEGLDAGLRFGNVIDADMVALPITKPMHRSLLASPAYFERHGVPIDPEALMTGHRVARFRFPGTGRLEPLHFERDGKPFDISPDPAVMLTDAAQFRSLLLAGLVIAQPFRLGREALIESGELVAVLEQYRPAPEVIHLCYPARRYVSAPLRAFIEWIARWRDVP